MADEELYDDDDVIIGEPTTWPEAERLEELEEQQRRTHAERTTNTPDTSANVVHTSSRNKFEDPLDILKQEKLKRIKLHMQSRGVKTSGSLSTTNPHFNPSYFLGVVHRETPYEELQKGCQRLQDKIDDQNTGLKNLVKENLDRFISCKDTLDDIYSSPDAVFKGQLINKLDNTYTDVQQRSNTLFEPLFERKQRAEQIRNVLDMMNRFKFMFNLPSDMKENHRRGEYKKVMRDYKRAKDIIQECDNNPLFRKVFDEVENHISEFRKEIFDLLKKSSGHIGSTDHIIQLITYLKKLDSPTDPESFYLSHLNSFISENIQKCADEYSAKIDALEKTNWRDAQDEMGSSYTYGSTTNSSSTDVISDILEVKIKQTFKVIKKLSQIVNKHVPEFWSLAQNTISTDLNYSYTEDYRSPPARSEPRTPDVTDMVQDIMQKYAQEVSNAFRVMDSETSHQPLWAGALQIILDCYRNLSTMIPAELLDPLLRNVYELRKEFVKKTCERAVHEVSLMCTASPQSASAYANNVSPVMGDAEEEVEGEEDDEDESLSSTTNLPNPSMPMMKLPTEEGHRRNGDMVSRRKGFISRANVTKTQWGTRQTSPVHTTNIPRLFRNHMLETVKLVRPIITPLHSSWKSNPRSNTTSPKLNSDHLELSHLEDQSRIFINNACLGLADRMHELAFVNDPSNSTIMNSVSSAPSSVSPLSPSYSSSFPSTSKIDDTDLRLLMVIGDVYYMKKYVLLYLGTEFTRIFSFGVGNSSSMINGEDRESSSSLLISPSSRNSFSHNQHQHQHHHQQVISNDVWEAFETLQKVVFHEFVRKTGISIGKFVKEGILLSGFDYTNAQEPTEVRSYVLKLLLHLVLVHSHVERYIPVFTHGIFERLLERLAEQFDEYIHFIEDIGLNGALQLDVEINFVNEVLAKYLNRFSKQIFSNLGSKMNSIISKDSLTNSKSHKTLQIVSKTKQKTAAELACFMSKDQ